jgi:hypothetical protein
MRDYITAFGTAEPGLGVSPQAEYQTRMRSLRSTALPCTHRRRLIQAIAGGTIKFDLR